MQSKLEFVRFAAAPGANIRALCRQFGVSPTTGHKWLARYLEAGAAGLQEGSRRPHASPARCAKDIEAAVVGMRAAHPAWGGRKIRRALLDTGVVDAPSPSTITAILHRHGLPVGDFGGGAKPWTRFEHPEPNDLWQMDFKGWVRLGDGGKLH